MTSRRALSGSASYGDGTGGSGVSSIGIGGGKPGAPAADALAVAGAAVAEVDGAGSGDEHPITVDTTNAAKTMRVTSTGALAIAFADAA